MFVLKREASTNGIHTLDYPVSFRSLNRTPDQRASLLYAPPSLTGIGWETSLVKQRELIRLKNLHLFV